MPRIARGKEEVDAFRDKILRHALEIISADGFECLTMRNLGKRLGCAAKTIYNYYVCKEEIYLRVLIRGFEVLNNMCEAAIKGVSDPAVKLRALMNAYVAFGVAHPHYYNIMFNSDFPKYTNYIGTNMERVAWEEKEIAILHARRTERILAELPGANLDDDEKTYLLIRMWSGVHGIVSLRNSHALDEYTPDKDRFLERAKKRLLEELIGEATGRA